MMADHFEYLRPSTILDAAKALSDANGNAVVLGGGTMLIPRLTRREEFPSALVDLSDLDLNQITSDGEVITIGAYVTYDDLLSSSLISSTLPLLRQMAEGITGGRSITGQGTIVGSACFANPASDVPACLVALDARISLVDVNRTREVPVREFYTGAFHTARARAELAISIVIPIPLQPHAAAYRKVKPSGSSWPILTVACVGVTLPTDEIVFSLSIGGLFSTPKYVKGIVPFGTNENCLNDILTIDGSSHDSWEDELGTAQYRALVAPDLAIRVFRTMTERFA